MLTAAAVRGGLEPDLLCEVVWWQSDDHWEFTFYGRGHHPRLGRPPGNSVEEVVEQLAELHGIPPEPLAGEQP